MSDRHPNRAVAACRTQASFGMLRRIMTWYYIILLIILIVLVVLFFVLKKRSG
jgi:lipoprotein signal peptidase